MPTEDITAERLLTIDSALYAAQYALSELLADYRLLHDEHVDRWSHACTTIRGLRAQLAGGY